MGHEVWRLRLRPRFNDVTDNRISISDLWFLAVPPATVGNFCDDLTLLNKSLITYVPCSSSLRAANIEKGSEHNSSNLIAIHTLRSSQFSDDRPKVRHLRNQLTTHTSLNLCQLTESGAASINSATLISSGVLSPHL